MKNIKIGVVAAGLFCLVAVHAPKEKINCFFGEMLPIVHPLPKLRRLAGTLYKPLDQLLFAAEELREPRPLRRLAAGDRSTGRPARARRYEQMMRHVDRADSAPASAGVAGAMVSDDANNLQRFAALKRILDAGLITQEEYDERREANLGVLLPLTQPAPALIAERQPPLVRDVVERLVTITRFKQAGALVGHAFDVERDAILEGLMPMPKSELRKIAAVVPEALDPESHQHVRDRLLVVCAS